MKFTKTMIAAGLALSATMGAFEKAGGTGPAAAAAAGGPPGLRPDRSARIGPDHRPNRFHADQDRLDT